MYRFVVCYRYKNPIIKIIVVVVSKFNCVVIFLRFDILKKNTKIKESF